MNPTEPDDVELKMLTPKTRNNPLQSTADVIHADTAVRWADGGLADVGHADELMEFVQILKDDNVEAFHSWPEERQSLYRRGRFDYKTVSDASYHSPMKALEVPFHLAVGYGATKLVNDFIEKGVDLTRIDIKQHNVLHIASLAASMRRDKEDDFVPITNALLDATSPDVLVELCTQENSEGLRPLEFASILGTFSVYNCLIERQGYLKGDAKVLGLSEVHKYDISDYEPGGGLTRLIRNPIKLMIFVDRAGFDSLKKFCSLDLPIVQKWSQHQLKTCLPFLLIWWAYKLVFLWELAYLDPAVLLYESMCSNFSEIEIRSSNDASILTHCQNFVKYNDQDLRVSLNLNRVLVIWSSIMVAVDLLEVIIRLVHNDRRRAYSRLYTRSFASFTMSYRLSIFGLYVIALIAPRVGAMYSGGEAFRQLLLVKAFQLPLVLYSLLHIIEYQPVLGIFAITIQKMLVSLVVFLSFLLPVKLVFSQFLQFFAKRYGFGNLGDSIYNLFLMDMGSFDFNTEPDLVVKLVHVFYFLVMIILLFNYLIAVLSIVADQTDEDRKLLLKLRRLQMNSEIEERVGYWVRLAFRLAMGRRNRRTTLVA